MTLGSQKIHSQLTKIELKKLLKAIPPYKYIMTMFEPIATFVKKQLSQNKQPHKKWTDSEKKKAFEDFWDFIMMNANPEQDRVENNLEIRKLKKFHQNSSSKLQRDYYFVTICPPDSVKLELIMKTMHKISKWTCWSSFIGVLEQRSTKESDIYGIHIHFLAKKAKKYAPSNVKQRIGYYGKKWNTDVQIIDSSFAKDKQDYFFEKTGTKKNGEKKAKAMEIDELWRKKHGIPRFFGEKINLE